MTVQQLEVLRYTVHESLSLTLLAHQSYILRLTIGHLLHLKSSETHLALRRNIMSSRPTSRLSRIALNPILLPSGHEQKIIYRGSSHCYYVKTVGATPLSLEYAKSDKFHPAYSRYNTLPTTSSSLIARVIELKKGSTAVKKVSGRTPLTPLLYNLSHLN